VVEAHQSLEPRSHYLGCTLESYTLVLLHALSEAFWNIMLGGQSKKLCKLCELDAESSTISQPHKDSLFRVKEEGGIELSDDFLILIVLETQQVCDAIKSQASNILLKCTSFLFLMW
jgi:hypothetical protein